MALAKLWALRTNTPVSFPGLLPNSQIINALSKPQMETGCFPLLFKVVILLLCSEQASWSGAGCRIKHSQEGGERTRGRRQRMSVKNIPVCSYKNGKLALPASAETWKGLVPSILKNPSTGDAPGSTSSQRLQRQLSVHREKPSWCSAGMLLMGQETAGAGDSRGLAQHCALLSSHLPVLPAQAGLFPLGSAQGMEFSSPSSLPSWAPAAAPGAEHSLGRGMDKVSKPCR